IWRKRSGAWNAIPRSKAEEVGAAVRTIARATALRKGGPTHMMGTKARVFTPITALSLDEVVPPDHFYRHLDRVPDLSFVRDLVRDCYAAGVGRPSIDPVVFFRARRDR